MAKNENKENREHDFSKILASAGSNMSIQIKRMQPTWCDGVLVEEEIDPEDIIDIEHIREQWGGRKMKLTIRQDGAYRASTTIKFPDPPKKDGVVLINPEIAAAQAPAAPPQQDNKFFEIILAMQSSQADALAAIQKQNADAIKEAQTTSAAAHQNALENQLSDLKNQIADMRNADPAPAPEEKLSALDTIKEAAETFKEVQGLQASIGGDGGGASDQFSFLSEGIKQVMAMHMKQKKMEMEMMIEKQRQSREEAKPPPLEDRPAQIQATEPEQQNNPTAPPNMASLAPMLQAFKSIPVEQQAALVSAHIEQLDDDERVDFLSALAGSDFIEEEAEEEEPETEAAEPAEIKTLDITPEPN